MTDVLVVGGGPAGMMAALAAADNGKSVLLLEKNDRLGKKLRITGKGRCNVCNHCGNDAVVASVPGNGRFLYGALSRFSPADVMAFFEGQGVPLKTERGRRVFPQSDRAQDIVDALTHALKKAGVQVRYQADVRKIEVEDTRAADVPWGTAVLRGSAVPRGNAVPQGTGVNRVTGVTLKTGEFIPAHAVVAAVGGASYPGTGSTGDAIPLLQGLQIRTVPFTPSLVPVTVPGDDCRDMMGLSLRNCTLRVTDEKKGKRVVFEELGEMLFTHFGLSGPLILSASAHMRPMECARYLCHVDVKPALDAETLDRRLQRDLQANQNREIGHSLAALLPRSMIPVILRRSGIDPQKRCHDITREERRALGERLKNMEFPVSGFRPIEEAIVSAGGVDLREVDPKTMRVKKYENLYLAGEMLNLDAYTGGYNLQIAFSTGRLAGSGA
ncbi:MAG: NAD(P)/FAD-dependent oxidoreductase [Clostridia bacterium]|nr:NAD(P)/FAD-dependent oxidoreductase [Clostridia bacterium]